MITAPTRLDFIEPTTPHAPPAPPKSGKRRFAKDPLKRAIQGGIPQPSISDVAKKLEEKYDLLMTFVVMKKEEIERIIAYEMALAIKHGWDNDRMDAQINTQVSTLWRIYIQNEEHQIVTKASIKENRQSFIKTGEYYTGLSIGVSR